MGSFYAGISAAALGSMPSSLAFYSVWTALKDGVKMNVFGASALAEVVACVVRVPCEVVKQRMQCGMHRDLASAMRSVWRSRDTFVGFWPCIARDVPFALLQYPLFCFLRTINWPSDHQLPASLCGMLSGAVAGAATAPLDFIKTAAMTHRNSLFISNTALFRQVPKSGQSTRTLLASVRNLRETHGLGIFFAGIVPRIVWLGVGGAVYLGAFDAAFHLFLNSSLFCKSQDCSV